MVNLTITRGNNIKATMKATEPPDQQKQSFIIPNVDEGAQQRELSGGSVNQPKPLEHSLAAFAKAEPKKLDS